MPLSITSNDKSEFNANEGSPSFDVESEDGEKLVKIQVTHGQSKDKEDKSKIFTDTTNTSLIFSEYATGLVSRILPFLPIDEAPSILQELSTTFSLIQRQIGLLKSHYEEEFSNKINEMNAVREENIILKEKTQGIEQSLQKLRDQNTIFLKERDEAQHEVALLRQSSDILKKKLDNHQMKFIIPGGNNSAFKEGINYSLNNDHKSPSLLAFTRSPINHHQDALEASDPSYDITKGNNKAHYENQERLSHHINMFNNDTNFDSINYDNFESKSLAMMQAYKDLLEREYTEKEKVIEERYRIMLENNTNLLRIENEENINRLKHDIETDILHLKQATSSGSGELYATSKILDNLDLQKKKLLNDAKDSVVNLEVFGSRKGDNEGTMSNPSNERTEASINSKRKDSTILDENIPGRKEDELINDLRLGTENQQNLHVGQVSKTKVSSTLQDQTENETKLSASFSAEEESLSQGNRSQTTNTHTRRRSSLNELLQSLDLG